MAFCEILASRVRDELIDKDYYSEKRMFGGLAFMLNGNMVCAIVGDDLVVRVGIDSYEECLEKDNADVFNITGKVMRGWVIVKGDTLNIRKDLLHWVSIGVNFCLTLPVK